MKAKNSWFVMLVMTVLLASVLTATLAAADEGKGSGKSEKLSAMGLRMKMVGDGFSDFAFKVKKFFAFNNKAKLELLEKRNEEMNERQNEWLEIKSEAMAQFSSGNLSSEQKKELLELIQEKHSNIIKHHLELTSELHELQLKEKETKVTAVVVGDKAEVTVKKEFFTTNTSKEAIVDEVINEFALDRATADALLKVSTNPNESLNEKFEVEAKVVNGVAKAEVELTFVLNETNREKILDAIVSKTVLTKEQINPVMEFKVSGAFVSKTEVEAVIVNGKAQVEVEKKFVTTNTSMDAIVDEIIREFALGRATADALLEVKTSPNENLEEELEVDVNVVNGVAQVKVELKFFLNETGRDKILDAIVSKTVLTKEQVNAAIEFKVRDLEDEIEAEKETKVKIEVKNGETRVKTEINGTKTELRLDTTNKTEIVAAIAASTGLSVSEAAELVPLSEEELEAGAELKAELEDGKLEIETESSGHGSGGKRGRG